MDVTYNASATQKYNHINIYLATNHTKTVALCENTYVRLQDDQKDH